MTFGYRIKEARKKEGLTQGALAKKIGVAKSTLSGYEKGQREPTVATTAEIIKSLDIDANFLYQDYYPSDDEINHEDKALVKTFKSLDPHGQGLIKTILESECSRAKIASFPQYSMVSEEPIKYNLSTAHERTDIAVADNTREFDDDIMDSDDF